MPLFRRTCKSGVKLKVVLSSWFRLFEILLLFFEETYHMRKWLSLEGPVGQFFREVFGLEDGHQRCANRTFFLNFVKIEVQSQESKVTGTPCARATAPVCTFVSAITLAVFHAVTTRERTHA